MIRELRFRRITPELLHQKIQRGEKVAVIDLLGFEGHDGAELGIPGSVRISAARLKNGPLLAVPKDVEIVLYCSSHQQILSARVALGLKRRGVRAVSVLEGGLDAWRHLGFELSNDFGVPEDIAARLGIEFLTKRV
ncbi:rhodanese-like domain-containing protein [Granulicella tundricola]|uniref:rhodanese-like domain-containing protein n=1 Tax=Granulicella tundricola TaxID=940615 RepID=UPI0001DB81F5|nr:rhodanese-like domain-containing protein [Granulicella tundricola]